MESRRDERITDWQQLVNKPVHTRDGKELGIVRTIQPENLVVQYTCSKSWQLSYS